VLQDALVVTQRFLVARAAGSQKRDNPTQTPREE